MFSEEVIPFHISKLKGREASSRPPRVPAPSQVPVPGPVQEEHSTKKCPFHPAFRLRGEPPTLSIECARAREGVRGARSCPRLPRGCGSQPIGATCALGGVLLSSRGEAMQRGCHWTAWPVPGVSPAGGGGMLVKHLGGALVSG